MAGKLKVVVLYDRWEPEEDNVGRERQGAARPHARQEGSRGGSGRRADQARARADAAPARRLAQEPARAARSSTATSSSTSASRSPATTPPTTTSRRISSSSASAFTGAGSHGLMLAQDKSVAKKIFAFHGIATPVFARSFRGRLAFSHELHFPGHRQADARGRLDRHRVQRRGVVDQGADGAHRLAARAVRLADPDRGVRRGARDVRRRARQREPRGAAGHRARSLEAARGHAAGLRRPR